MVSVVDNDQGAGFQPELFVVQLAHTLCGPHGAVTVAVGRREFDRRCGGGECEYLSPAAMGSQRDTVEDRMLLIT
jgi:hypothetical protein